MKISLKELKKLIQTQLLLEASKEEEGIASTLASTQQLPTQTPVDVFKRIGGAAKKSAKVKLYTDLFSLLNKGTFTDEDVKTIGGQLPDNLKQDSEFQKEIAKFKNHFLQNRVKAAAYILYNIHKKFENEGASAGDIIHGLKEKIDNYDEYKKIADKIFKSEVKMPSEKNPKESKTFHQSFNAENAFHYMQQIHDDLEIYRLHGDMQKSDYDYYFLPFPIKNYQQGHLNTLLSQQLINDELDEDAQEKAKEIIKDEQNKQEELATNMRKKQKGQELHGDTGYYDIKMSTGGVARLEPVIHDILSVPMYDPTEKGSVGNKLADRIRGMDSHDYYVRLARDSKNYLTHAEKEFLKKLLGVATEKHVDVKSTPMFSSEKEQNINDILKGLLGEK